MKHSRKVTLVLVLLLVIGISFAYSSGSGETGKTYTIRAHYTNSPGEPQVQGAELFKEIVEEKTGGAVIVEIYPNNQLGGSMDVLASVQNGTIQMANVTGPMVNFVPEVKIFELPFMFKDKEHLNAVLDDPKVTNPIREAMEAKGFHLLGLEDVGLRHIMTTDATGPVESIDDLKGLKIRLMENPIHLEAYRAFGAAPLPMAYGELYTALEQDVIDGAEAANINYYSKSFYEPAPYWAQVGWINLIGYTVMSKVFYDELPREYQKIIDEASKESTRLERKLYAEWEVERLEDLKEKGVKVSYPDVEPFREAAQKVYEKYADDVGGMELIDAIRNYKY
jgi:tripartite ATP-independent transporter DctP family solute receptor